MTKWAGHGNCGSTLNIKLRGTKGLVAVWFGKPKTIRCQVAKKKFYQSRANNAGVIESGSQEQFPSVEIPPNYTPRFLVPAGVPIRFRNIFRGGDWQPSRTTTPHGFDRFERFVKEPGGNHFEFRADGGWLMLVASRFVKRRST
jgi:hypothetical protein